MIDGFRVYYFALLCFCANGEMFYERNSRGYYGANSTRAEISAEVPHPFAVVQFTDRASRTIRAISNAHFPPNIRESRMDSASRISRGPEWGDTLTATINLAMPKIPAASAGIRVTARVSRRAALASLDGAIGAFSCQLTMRPPRGSSSRNQVLLRHLRPSRTPKMMRCAKTPVRTKRAIAPRRFRNQWWKRKEAPTEATSRGNPLR